MWDGATGKAVGLSSLDRSLLKVVYLTKIPQEETEARQENAMASQGQQQRPQNYRGMPLGSWHPDTCYSSAANIKPSRQMAEGKGHPIPSSD